MGRSKFPGKPTKHTNRKRVNVLPPANGIPNGDAKVTVENPPTNKQDDEEEVQENSDLGTSSRNIVNTKVPLKRRRLSPKMQVPLRGKNSKRNLLTKMGSISARAKLRRKSLGSYQGKRSLSQKETSNLVGKFVLPSRSVHSSRVIKPNKRFISSELSDSFGIKKKVIAKRACKKVDDKPEPDEKVTEEKDDEKKPELPSQKIVLRQARLKLHNSQTCKTEGPFSTTSHTGTVTCGVCGAVRFYRFVKQAKKFNIYSCESCRKFISKMIKRQSCGKAGSAALECLKGQGNCHVVPLMRSQLKLNRCYRTRCPACWLKMCLRSFQMPMSLKHSLSQMLPRFMHGPDVAFSNTLPPLVWQQPVDNMKTFPETTIRQQRPVRQVKSAKPEQSAPTPPPTSDVKRQKIDLKGPRVKHVCRSASIVLGQPLAVFPIEKKKEEGTVPSPAEKPVEKPLEQPKPSKIESSSEECFSDNDKLKSERPERTFKPSLFNVKPVQERKRTVPELHNSIISDYCEIYDPSDISQNGFCLIGSERFTMPSICFLCGSGGNEALLYCSLCCEPYHSFCLEQPPSLNETNIKQSIWLCPKCTTCSECNLTERQKIHCQKCLKPYHSECFNKKWTSVDRATVCAKCLKCKGCEADNITKFVGNLPLCLNCFKMRKKGNFCPMCQHCYDEKECCSKMMECVKCNKWVHAKCEGLSDEQYQILSILPESVNYICSVCSKNKKQFWRKAMDWELQTSLNNVFRLLSKDKTARDILKFSPIHTYQASLNKTITGNRRLTFSDDYSVLENNNCPKGVVDINKIYTFEEDDVEHENESLSKIRAASQEKNHHVITMVDIKNKLNSNEYSSVREFNRDIEEALKAHNLHQDELSKIYNNIFQSVFPWYQESAQDVQEPKQEVNLQEEESQGILDQNHNYAKVEFHLPDKRVCSFCKNIGDGLNHQESRLLYCGQNEWVHANCALWSSEVYEEIDGSLQNVNAALSRGRFIRCTQCKRKGASVGCCYKGCHETYHFLCAKMSNNCKFLHDKTVYCSTHELPKNAHVLTTQKEFELNRSVYVELDKKKKRYSEIDKINLMVGSLCVKNLGKINPLVSDTPEAIIPLGFKCSRLYWSINEPWKLVPYNITTSFVNNHSSALYVDKNFTINHSLSKTIVEKMLRDVTAWQRELDKKKCDILEFEDDEEPQNGADLLSPELTNAILEELPHGLLDGISVQDILLSYDDLNGDFKGDNSESMDFKKVETDEDSIELDLKNIKGELRRSKSEVMPHLGGRIDPLSKSRGHQRSCSLTLSCKLDSSLSPAIKKRKIAAANRENNWCRLLQVDGNMDDDSSSSESELHAVEIWRGNNEQPVTCDKCQCTYRTKLSYKRHLETCEVLCTSESDSEITHEFDQTQQNNMFTSFRAIENQQVPVMVTQFESYQNEIHTSVLNTQIVTQNSEVVLQNLQQPQAVSQAVSVSYNHSETVEAAPPQEQFAISSNVENMSVSVPVSTNQYCVNQSVPICVNQSLLQGGIVNPSIINSNGNLLNQISINQAPIINQEFQPSVTIQPVPFANNVAPIINPQNLINGRIISNPIVQAVSVPTSQWIKPVPKPVVAQKAITKGRGGMGIVPQGSGGMILQHMPSNNFVPAFVDPLQQNSGQNLQYVTAIQTPQGLVQLSQPDQNLIRLVPSIQPSTTMIIQQPRLVENQLVLDSNGSLGWAQQTVQPVYYGFETIVQNTVMQSQQFLPTTVPGVLTANSSYSTTTQVFQTSKLEPVLDVSSNSFVLVNSGQLLNSQPIEVQQFPQPAQQPVNALLNNIVQPEVKPLQPVKYSPNSNSQHSITLPTAPFVPEQQGIPTNIVTPTPKPPTSIQSRPMNRVLPMQTTKEPKKIIEETKKVFIEDTPKIKIEECKILEDPKPKKMKVFNAAVRPIPVPVKAKTSPKAYTPLGPALPPVPEEIKAEPPKPKVFIVKNEIIKPVLPIAKPEVPVKVKTPEPQPVIEPPKVEKAPETESEKIDGLKMVFQKQGQDGIYKIGSNNNNNNPVKQPVQVAPFKPSVLTDKINKAEKFTEKEKPCSSKKDNENQNSILYTIETHDGYKYSSTSLTDLWDKVFEAVQAARAAHKLPPLPKGCTNVTSAQHMLGLQTTGLKYLIEQLPGATKCSKYKNTFNFPPHIGDQDEEFSTGHPFGAGRCMAYVSRKNENYDMFGWLASKHRKPPEMLSWENVEQLPRRGSMTSLPTPMRFRQLKQTSIYSVGVYRSDIHGRGLFCLRDIESGEMVIEYAGEVIRSVLSDKREKYYNSKGIGCYMFKVDDNFIIDATLKGNAARFINHSCEPNCYSKVVDILGHKHIIIFALRKILSGEELTYDYKFPFEEDKIPCTCGSKRCRKFLN